MNGGKKGISFFTGRVYKNVESTDWIITSPNEEKVEQFLKHTKTNIYVLISIINLATKRMNLVNRLSLTWCIAGKVKRNLFSLADYRFAMKFMKARPIYYELDQSRLGALKSNIFIIRSRIMHTRYVNLRRPSNLGRN